MALGHRRSRSYKIKIKSTVASVLVLKLIVDIDHRCVFGAGISDRIRVSFSQLKNIIFKYSCFIMNMSHSHDSLSMEKSHEWKRIPFVTGVGSQRLNNIRMYAISFCFLGTCGSLLV